MSKEAKSEEIITFAAVRELIDKAKKSIVELTLGEASEESKAKIKKWQTVLGVLLETKMGGENSVSYHFLIETNSQGEVQLSELEELSLIGIEKDSLEDKIIEIANCIPSNVLKPEEPFYNEGDNPELKALKLFSYFSQTKDEKKEQEIYEEFEKLNNEVKNNSAIKYLYIKVLKFYNEDIEKQKQLYKEINSIKGDYSPASLQARFQYLYEGFVKPEERKYIDVFLGLFAKKGHKESKWVIACKESNIKAIEELASEGIEGAVFLLYEQDKTKNKKYLEAAANLGYGPAKEEQANLLYEQGECKPALGIYSKMIPSATLGKFNYASLLRDVENKEYKLEALRMFLQCYDEVEFQEKCLENIKPLIKSNLILLDEFLQGQYENIIKIKLINICKFNKDIWNEFSQYKKAYYLYVKASFYLDLDIPNDPSGSLAHGMALTNLEEAKSEAEEIKDPKDCKKMFDLISSLKGEPGAFFAKGLMDIAGGKRGKKEIEKALHNIRIKIIEGKADIEQQEAAINKMKEDYSKLQDLEELKANEESLILDIKQSLKGKKSKEFQELKVRLGKVKEKTNLTKRIRLLNQISLELQLINEESIGGKKKKVRIGKGGRKEQVANTDIIERIKVNRNILDDLESSYISLQKKFKEKQDFLEKKEHKEHRKEGKKDLNLLSLKDLKKILAKTQKEIEERKKINKELKKQLSAKKKKSAEEGEKLKKEAESLLQHREESEGISSENDELGVKESGVEGDELVAVGSEEECAKPKKEENQSASIGESSLVVNAESKEEPESKVVIGNSMMGGSALGLNPNAKEFKPKGVAIRRSSDCESKDMSPLPANGESLAFANQQEILEEKASAPIKAIVKPSGFLKSPNVCVCLFDLKAKGLNPYFSGYAKDQ